MRVIMTGGGTGGHVNPALAIAGAIRANDPGSEIIFVGTSHGIENKLVPREGYQLRHIEIQGIRRSLSLSNIKTCCLALTSQFKAKKLLKEFKPDVVIGTGGYVCWPVVRQAARMGIPTALHESNAVPGFAVKMLEKHVDRMFVNFEETKKFLKCPDKAIRVGNPIRGEFYTLRPDEVREQLGIASKYQSFLLSYGGSMGAEQVNEEMLRFMRDYGKAHPELLHIHACGSIELECATARFREYGLEGHENLQLVEYIYDMPQKMAAADAVVCRAGAMTLSELAALAKPCALIPSPNVTNNHQYKNAKVLADAGAALLVEEKELSSGKLADALPELLGNKAKLKAMSDNISAFAINDCEKKIYSEIKKLVKSRNI